MLSLLTSSTARRHDRTVITSLVTLLSLALHVSAIGQDACVSFDTSSNSSFTIASSGKASSVYVASDDWLGVQRAATDFVADIQRVTGVAPVFQNVSASDIGSISSSEPIIIVGTLGKSSLLNAVVNNTQLDVSSVQGQWEAYVSRVVKNPLPGVESAYVLVGSDKRGSIYALYDHSEQFGVSPWYWWADAQVAQHDNLLISGDGCTHGTPTVKYRGIFLNDEQPALQNWAMEKFTNGTGSSFSNSPFNSQFYSKLFELILRLRANYLWPAMWSSAFAEDDTLNQYTADMYGVVMGTSHQEPMMRATPNEWNKLGKGAWNYTTNSQNVYNYWVEGTERAKPFESLYTLGMRGAGDLPLEEDTNVALLEKVVSDQRQILMDVYNTTDVTTIPQLWALYKEVQGYYEDGMRVPDDVILLWTDDNWGNIRRLPTDSERNHTGGAGVYYHVDYVGDPRDYKWITSSQISKTYEQMSLAVDRDAVACWILNVGDLKPYELSTEFFLAYGYDASKWSYNNLDQFVASWAKREFGVADENAGIVADIIGNVTRWNARKKPELLNGSTYSLIDYREADTVLAGWEALTNASTAVYNTLSDSVKPAYFQMVHHPVLASSNLGAMWIAQGMNALRASQARLSTNDLATQVEELFEKDYDLEAEYHSLLDGKWDHMMDQTHVMYYYWQQPQANTMPPVSRVQSRKQALAGPMRVVPENTLGAWPGDNPNQCSQGYSCPTYTIHLDRYAPIQSKYIDIGAGGPNPFTFSITSNVTWLKFSQTKGSISPNNSETRVEASVDWDQLSSSATALIRIGATITGSGLAAAQAIGASTQSTSFYFSASSGSVPDGFSGFVEGDGGVSIEAGHASRNTSVSGVTWTELPGLGRTLSGVTPWPRMGNGGANFSAGTGPSLEYDFYTFNAPSSGNMKVTTYVSPSLNANSNSRPLAFGIQLLSPDSSSESAIQVQHFIPLASAGNLPNGWDGVGGWVANSIVSVNTTFSNVSPGKHTLKLWMIEPAVVLQKFVVDTGNVRPSFLGPPESVIIS